jgi:hypothetical protein
MENAAMKPADDITKAISQFEVRGAGRLDERVRAHVYEAFGNSADRATRRSKSHRWRLILDNRTAPLAAAAAIVIAVLVGLHVWDLLGGEVYAVTQTIEALRKVETSHAFCRDWEGHKFEMWIRPDPATATNDFICLTEAERDYVVISTPQVSYYYYPGRNLVRIVRGQLITSDLDLARMVESLTSEADKNGDSVQISRKTTDRYGEVISLHCEGAAHEYEAWVDPGTKLLVGLEFTRTSTSGEVVKSIEEIRYNEPVPDRLLHFQCPDDAVIKPEGWGKIDDPNYGIAVAGLSEQQACVRILTDLFAAVNAADLDRMRALLPFAATLNDQALVAAVYQSLGGTWDDPTPGLAGYEIGSPYRDKACPLGVLVPCVLTDHEGGRFEVTLIVRFRRIEGRESCVVVFTWGRARRIEG